MEFLIAADTDKGIRKDTNQDSLLLRIADSKYGKILFAVICDGMGGYEKGELASKTVVSAFSEWFENELPILLKQGICEEDLKESLIQLIQVVNQKIMQYGNEKGIYLGTTMSLFLVIQDTYYIVHVGDCRIYEIKNSPVCITKDQTVLERDIGSGENPLYIDPSDKRKHILLQCIGTSPKVTPVFQTGTVKIDTIYLLCSDGFYHEITEDEIFYYMAPEKLRSAETMKESARTLINLNMQRKEKDNISAALIRTYGEN